MQTLADAAYEVYQFIGIGSDERGDWDVKLEEPTEENDYTIPIEFGDRGKFVIRIEEA